MENNKINKIEIEIPDGKRAEWVNGVLTLVDDTPKDVRDRIKTFDDACEEALKIAKESGQVKETNSKRLFSEDLY